MTAPQPMGASGHVKRAGASPAMLAERPLATNTRPASEPAEVAQIPSDVAGIVGALGLSADATSVPDIFGRVSLHWTSEDQEADFIDVAEPSFGASTSPGRDLAQFAPWRAELAAVEAALGAGRGDELRVDYSVPFSTSAGGGFDVDVSPRASVVAGEAISGATAGAIVRFGRNLSSPRRRSDERGWHFFVGADAQALTWKLDRSMSVDRSLRVESFQMLGDAQAGVALDVWGGDLAFGLIQRELKYEDAHVREHFGGVTYKVTW